MRKPQYLEDAAEIDTCDDGDADVDPSPYFHFQVFDLAARQSLPLGKDLAELDRGLTQLEEALDATLAVIAFPGPASFVTVCYGGTGCWADDGSAEDFLDRIEPLDDMLKSVASKAMGDGPDSPMGDGRPIFDDDHGNKLWLHVFFDKTLDSIHRKVHSYKRLINQFARKPVPTPEPPPSPPISADQRSRHLDGLLAEVPKDAPYEAKAENIAALNHEFRQRIAAELAPALNAHIQAMPHETLDQKKELARWVNEQLEPLGLAVQEPKTGRPGKLRGATGNWPGAGCFQIEVKIDGKQEYPTVSDTLPTLQLMDAEPPQEVRAGYRELVKRKLNRTFPGTSHAR
jgi:hypothetical protein